MKISVVTPVYNGEKFIRQTIESVLSQQGDFELQYIIRDGASTDSTLDILAEYRDRCVIISEKDGSPQTAINRGMEMADGDIGCWLNADDIFLPGALAAVAGHFRDNPNHQWLYGQCRIIDEHNREIRRPVTWYKNLLGFNYSRNLLLCENYINQPATFWRMDLWRRANHLNPAYKAAWDYELWLKMAETARPGHIRKYLSCFRRHDSSISENNFERQFREEVAIGDAYGNPIHRFFHRIMAGKTVLVYNLLKRP